MPLIHGPLQLPQVSSARDFSLSEIVKVHLPSPLASLRSGGRQDRCPLDLVLRREASAEGGCAEHNAAVYALHYTYGGNPPHRQNAHAEMPYVFCGSSEAPANAVALSAVLTQFSQPEGLPDCEY